jgi:xanthine permease
MAWTRRPADGAAGDRVVEPVDEVPPLRQLIPLGLQHVLAMYAGAVAVPLIVGGALIAAHRLNPGDLPYLVNADLLVAGIATLIQSVGFWRFGVRLPLIQGCTFAAVTPMILIGSDYGVTAIYGSVIAAGLLMILLSTFFAGLLRFFPPLVTGTVILIIGLSLIPVAAGWITQNKESAGPGDVALAAFVLLLVLLIERLAPAPLARVSILLAIVIGTLVAIPLGKTNWDGVGDQAWLGISTPFHFGLPSFQVGSVIAMLIVALVTMTETTGDILAIGELVETEITPQRLADGLRADGLSTLLGGIFNTFPYTAFAQNVGLVGLTRVKTRYVATVAGLVLIVLGLIPKLGAVVSGVPLPVLGGAGIALFGMVAASGVRTLSAVRFTNSNILVVAIAVGIGLLPVVQPGLYAGFPDWFQTIFNSGISAGALVAIVLNLVLKTDPGDAAPGLAAYDAVREQPPIPVAESTEA